MTNQPDHSGKPKVTATKELITPEIAKKWLARNARSQSPKIIKDGDHRPFNA